jgi:tetratricopeptide (TPR) repeat protein
VRSLPSVPPLPRLAAIAEDDRPGAKAGAVRIRAERITGLYPRREATVLPGEIPLRFQPVTGAGTYRVEVQDEQGRTLFAADTASSTIEVPAGTLRAGRRYHWTVRTLNRPGGVARGEADLVVLSEGAAQARAETRKILESEGPGSLSLLAAIDYGLGLLLEAREGLRAALDGKPGDSALQEALAGLESTLSEEEPEEGAVVEEVAPGSAAEKSGIRPGDLVLSWSRDDETNGALGSAFDLDQVGVDQAPRGEVVLRGRREKENRQWALARGFWGIKARPTLPEALLAPFRQGRGRIAAGDLDGGARLWRSAVEAAEREQDPLRASWLQSRLARELGATGRWSEADAAWEQAIQRLESPGPLPPALLRPWCETLQQRSLLGRAEECHRRALALDAEKGLGAAWGLSALGAIASLRGDLAAAEDLQRQALALRESLAAGSLEHASSLRYLAILDARRGNLDGAEKRFLRALEIAERGRVEPRARRLPYLQSP